MRHEPTHDGGARPRVLVVGHGPPTSGGIPSFVTRITADAWLAERCSIEFLNTAPRGVKRPGAFTGSNLWHTAVHAWAIFRGSRGTDVVHLNLAATPTLPLIRAIVLTAAARLGRSAVILHAHTGMIEGCVRGSLFRRLLRLELRIASLLIVVSRPAAAAAGPLGPVAYLPNGVDPDAFATGPKESDPALMLFVGTVAERKGLLDLRDALVAIRPDGAPPIRVAIVGDGEQEGPGSFDAIRAAFARAGLQHVEFAGALDHDRTAALMARAGIFCLPSHSEGFPLAVLEAMASEAAVIGTDVGDIREIIGAAEAGIVVPPSDPDALGAAIRRLADDRRERERLGAAGRRRVQREYSQRLLVERLFALYASVVPRASAARRTPRSGAIARG